jgi:uncharacterized membrane protein
VIAGLRRHLGERWIAAIALSAILSLVVLVLFYANGRHEHSSILWNLLLAWIPLGLAVIVYRGATSGLSSPVMTGLGALWLVFLPNAPYLVTDLRYADLQYLSKYTAPVLYETVLLTAAACTGLLLGLTSLFLMHVVARRLVGVVNGWAFVVGALALSAFGTYLGRAYRWNSWDVFTRPASLAGHLMNGLLDPLDHPRLIALTALFTSLLLVSYLAFYFLVRMGSLSTPAATRD